MWRKLIYRRKKNGGKRLSDKTSVSKIGSNGESVNEDYVKSYVHGIKLI